MNNPLGRRAQVGGGVAVFLGVLLLVAAGPGAGGPVDLHKMAVLFVVIGAVLFLAGTFARWYYGA